jgi:hypothetical protein
MPADSPYASVWNKRLMYIIGDYNRLISHTWNRKLHPTFDGALVMTQVSQH